MEPPVEEKQVIAAALKPRELVKYLDKFIVGQPDAKRAVAIALRNRWRRHKLPDALKSEVRRRNGNAIIRQYLFHSHFSSNIEDIVAN